MKWTFCYRAIKHRLLLKITALENWYYMWVSKKCFLQCEEKGWYAYKSWLLQALVSSLVKTCIISHVDELMEHFKEYLIKKFWLPSVDNRSFWINQKDSIWLYLKENNLSISIVKRFIKTVSRTCLLLNFGFPSKLSS